MPTIQISFFFIHSFIVQFIPETTEFFKTAFQLNACISVQNKHVHVQFPLKLHFIGIFVLQSQSHNFMQPILLDMDTHRASGTHTFFWTPLNFQIILNCSTQFYSFLHILMERSLFTLFLHCDVELTMLQTFQGYMYSGFFSSCMSQQRREKKTPPTHILLNLKMLHLYYKSVCVLVMIVCKLKEQKP